jgi:hypothetical protein
MLLLTASCNITSNCPFLTLHMDAREARAAAAHKTHCWPTRR